MSDTTADHLTEASPKVNFYLLSSSEQTGFLHFVCRLTEKALQRNNYVYIYCPFPATAATLDSLLYSFRADSFLPHCQLAKPLSEEDYNKPEFPIYLGNEHNSVPAAWLVINLSDRVYASASHIIEIVPNDSSQKKSARQKFTRYRELGYELKTHNV